MSIKSGKAMNAAGGGSSVSLFQKLVKHVATVQGGF